MWSWKKTWPREVSGFLGSLSKCRRASPSKSRWYASLSLTQLTQLTCPACVAVSSIGHGILAFWLCPIRLITGSRLLRRSKMLSLYSSKKETFTWKSSRLVLAFKSSKRQEIARGTRPRSSKWRGPPVTAKVFPWPLLPKATKQQLSSRSTASWRAGWATSWKIRA